MAGEWRDNPSPGATPERRSRLGPRHRRQQGAAQHQSRRAARRARGARRQARLQCQVHHRDGRGDRLAGSGGGLRIDRDELEADVFIASDGPRLAADRPTMFLGCRGGLNPSRCRIARSRPSLRQLGRRASPIPRPYSPARSPRWSMPRPSVARGLEAAAAVNQIRPCLPMSRSSRLADEPALSPNRGEAGPARGGAALRLEYARGAGDVLRQYRQACKCHPGHAHAVLQLRFVVGTRSTR